MIPYNECVHPYMTDDERAKIWRWNEHGRFLEREAKVCCMRAMQVHCEVVRVHDHEPAWKRRRRS